jgi:hypothetical protein
MGRVFIVAGCWFLFWMTFGAIVGGLSAGPGAAPDGVFFGARNGAWIAALTSFAWPWIMPESINRWMDGRGA